MFCKWMAQAWNDEPLAVISAAVFAVLIGLPIVPAAVLALCAVEWASMQVIDGIRGCVSLAKTRRCQQRQALAAAAERRKLEAEERTRPERDRVRREETLRAAHEEALAIYRRAVESANRIADQALRDEVIGAAEIKYRERMSELL